MVCGTGKAHTMTAAVHEISLTPGILGRSSQKPDAAVIAFFVFFPPPGPSCLLPPPVDISSCVTSRRLFAPPASEKFGQSASGPARIAEALAQNWAYCPLAALFSGLLVRTNGCGTARR